MNARPSAKLLDGHRELERSFEALLNAVEGADEPTIIETWTQFERLFNAHLKVEEGLLARLESGHRREVCAIREEHVKIRHLLGELGIRADLHTLRRDVADDFIAELKRHAAREESGIYRWADRELGFPHPLRSVTEFAKELRTARDAIDSLARDSRS